LYDSDDEDNRQVLNPFDEYEQHEYEEHQLLPVGFAVSVARVTNVVELMAEATNNTMCALLECALCKRGALPETVTNHLRQTLGAVVPNFEASASGPVLAARLRPHLGPELVHELVDNEQLQGLLKDDDHLPSLICGLVRMNKSGREYILEDPSNVPKGLCVLESASGMVDSLFIHLRENATLCSR
jgi:hypothetical protein